MVPDTKTLLAIRALVVAVSRLVGTVFLPIGLIFLAGWLIEGLHDGDLWSWRYYFERVLTGGFCTAAGFITLVLARPLARLFVPIRPPRWPPRCPACRYRLVTLTKPICPECGLALPREFVADSAKPEGHA